MRLRDLSPEVRSTLEFLCWDRIIEKHEGPENWKYLLKDDCIDFLRVDNFEVLLPIDKENHANITIDRCFPSEDGKILTIFLTDVSYDTDIFAGRLAVCERVPDQDWFITIVFHECWVGYLESHAR